MHADVARRALALIADGLVDRAGVPGLARRLGYSERQLHRILVAELGAGAIALARAQRAQAARLLIDSADLTLGEIALAAGFGSVRQFNDTMRQVYGTTPAALRTGPRPATGIRLRLPAKAPFDGAAVVRFLARHEVPGLEHVQHGAYTRALALEHGGGLVTLTPKRDALICELKLDDLRDLSAAVARCRRLFDLDADPQAIHAHLARLPVVGELVRRAPGIRIAGAVDGFELAVRTIIRRENDYELARASTAQAGPSLRRPAAGSHARRHPPLPHAERAGGRGPRHVRRRRPPRARHPRPRAPRPLPRRWLRGRRGGQGAAGDPRHRTVDRQLHRDASPRRSRRLPRGLRSPRSGNHAGGRPRRSGRLAAVQLLRHRRALAQPRRQRRARARRLKMRTSA